MAIATYERTLIADGAPVTLGATLTPIEAQGRLVFDTLGCNVCHRGPLFTDQAFHYIGVRPVPEDLGRFEVTGQPIDRGAMKTPSLLGVALRAPYFHDGSQATLAGVVDFYDRGGDFDAPNKAAAIRPLGLTQRQKDALVAFLGRPLTDPRVAAETAPFARPVLYSESARVPSVFGAGAAGAGGFVPAHVAVEPGLLGNPGFTLAVVNGRGGAFAWLGYDVVAAPPGTTVLGGLPLFLALSSAFALVPTGPLDGANAGGGHRTVVAALPADPALIGLDVFAQWLIRDPAAAHVFATTPGLRVPLFGAPGP
jgi:hypothetical protein